MSDVVEIGGRRIELSHQDRVLFPEAGLTKGDLVQYYRRVAGTMGPHLAERPLNLHRFPHGIEEPGFIQQHAADYFPDWIPRVTVEKERGVVTHVVGGEAATLVYLANQGVVTLHAWLSRADRLHHPDRLIFDLDPPGDDFAPVRRAAFATHDLLEDLGLAAFVMTTGSKGLHVTVPLDRSADFDATRAFARAAAEVLAARHPEELTVEQRKAKRKGRVYLDVMRNAYGQTAVSPYAVRARPGAPVATPLDWDEVGNPALHPRRYTLGNLFRRLGQKRDPWADIDAHARPLAEAHRRLATLRG